MRMKTVSTIVLLAFVALTLAWLVRDRVRSPAGGEAAAPVAEASAPARESQLLVYYFHTNVRCPSCLKIEDLTRRTVDQWFDGPVREGLVAWRPVNIEEAGNEHFIDEYELTVKSVVIVDWRDGRAARWKNLGRVWELLDDDEAFVTYVRDEVGAWLDGVS